MASAFWAAVIIFSMVTAATLVKLLPLLGVRRSAARRPARCNRPRDHVRWPHMHAANTSTSCWSLYGKECPVHGPNAMKNTRGRWTCPGATDPRCQCDGSCGFTATGGHNCLCSRCTPVPATAAHPPNPVPTPGCACPMCTTARAGTITPGSSNVISFNGGSGGAGGSAGGGGGSVLPFPGGSAGGSSGGSAGGSSGSSAGSGGGGGSWSHNTGGVPPGRSAGGSAGGSGIMNRITPRPAGRGASGGLPGFAEQGSGDFDFAVGSVRGLRQWNLLPPDLNSDPTRASWNPPMMKGATGQFLWQNGVNEASCNSNRSHKPPVDFDEHGAACGCGFWAYWNIQSLATGGAMSVNPNTGLPITGLIEGTGRVLIGDRGFRSQRAKIIALAPAFSVQAYSPPDYGDQYRRSMPRSRVITYGSPEQQTIADAERETREAQERADAWMAVIQDRLGLMYPDSFVFATLKGMLASVVTGEIT